MNKALFFTGLGLLISLALKFVPLLNSYLTTITAIIGTILIIIGLIK